MTGDLFTFANDRPAVAPPVPPKRSLPRPEREVLEGLRFAIKVSTMVTIARRTDDPGAALATVRRQLAEREKLDVTEREIAAINHRHGERVGMRKVPTFAEAMRRVAEFWWVPK